MVCELRRLGGTTDDRPISPVVLLRLEERLERINVVWVPSGERWPVLDDVACSPEDAAPVYRAGDIVVRAQGSS